jgi:type IV secretion system protein VirB4
VALLEQRSGPMNPLQAEAIKSPISQNGKAPEVLRNFRAFQEVCGDVGNGLEGGNLADPVFAMAETTS